MAPSVPFVRRNIEPGRGRSSRQPGGSGLALRRGDADGGDLIALALEDLEAEAEEAEDLADLRNGARLVHDEAGEGGGLLVGETPVELAVEVADGDAAVDDVAAVRLGADPAHRDVELVGDVADNLLEDVLEGDDAEPAAVLVDHQGEMGAALAEGLELVEERRR